jgi:hypothetical protein
VFDIWDVMLSEMEDTLAEGFKGYRQLPYANWITFLLWKAVTQMFPETMAEWSGATCWAFLTSLPKVDLVF